MTTLTGDTMRISTSWITVDYGGIRWNTGNSFLSFDGISRQTRRTHCGCHVGHWTMNVSLLSSQYGTLMIQVIQSFAG